MKPQDTTALVSGGSRVIAAAIALRPIADSADILIDAASITVVHGKAAI